MDQAIFVTVDITILQVYRLPQDRYRVIEYGGGIEGDGDGERVVGEGAMTAMVWITVTLA